MCIRDRYMVGHQLTIADISVAVILVFAFRLCFGEKDRQRFPSIVRHTLTVASLQNFQRFCGRLIICKKEFSPFSELPIEHNDKQKEAKNPKQYQQQQPKKESKKEENS
eukprot:TRINITY_DN2863_c0_g1_i29.p1 TRINITY_DN2863_c0_g1~~TRINITY_DN2863_c0_g1_i29.p1  ORF type:complete len:109 (-),score=12.53 TRINITY_DN2863_c0_g1_i29:165-491(-)